MVLTEFLLIFNYTVECSPPSPGALCAPPSRCSFAHPASCLSWVTHWNGSTEVSHTLWNQRQRYSIHSSQQNREYMFLKACSWRSGRGCTCWCACLPWSTACTTPWSTILLRFLIFLYIHRSEYLVWHWCEDSQNQTLFRPMGAQITFIIFPPMRWELSKLNKSSYPQSRILSPFAKQCMCIITILKSAGGQSPKCR